MAFGRFQSMDEVAVAYRIPCLRDEFVQPIAMPIREYFRSELDFTLREVGHTTTEFTACENFIRPILREVWRLHLRPLMVWGHEPLHFDERLSGVPDYLVAQRSPLGPVRGDSPYVLAVIEAKRDDFDQGWGQCLAAMVAARKLHGRSDLDVFGIVSNGRTWEFGRLNNLGFTQDPRSFSLQHLAELLGAVNYAFTQCSEHVTRQTAVA